MASKSMRLTKILYCRQAKKEKRSESEVVPQRQELHVKLDLRRANVVSRMAGIISLWNHFPRSRDASLMIWNSRKVSRMVLLWITSAFRTSCQTASLALHSALSAAIRLRLSVLVWLRPIESVWLSKRAAPTIRSNLVQVSKSHRLASLGTNWWPWRRWILKLSNRLHWTMCWALWPLLLSTLQECRPLTVSVALLKLLRPSIETALETTLLSKSQSDETNSFFRSRN